MNIIEYFHHHKSLIVTNPIIQSWEYQEDIRTSSEGFFKARLHFVDNSILDFREYVNIMESKITRYTYSFHYSQDQGLIFRYDNTPHHPHLSSFPHHKHLSTDKVIACLESTLQDVLTEIENIILSK